MGTVNSNLSIEKLNKIFVDKYTDYLELMRIAGCTNDDLVAKGERLTKYKELFDDDKARVVKDDLSFLSFFTSGGISLSDEKGTKLYDGINKEIAHSVINTMSSIKKSVVLPKEYEDELDEPVTLPNIKDMISYDMSQLFPDIKKLFFLGEAEEFHKRMTRVFDDSSKIEEFSDIVDASVNNNNESGLYNYMDLVNEAMVKARKISFDEKSKNLS